MEDEEPLSETSPKVVEDVKEIAENRKGNCFIKRIKHILHSVLPSRVYHLSNPQSKACYVLVFLESEFLPSLVRTIYVLG